MIRPITAVGFILACASGFYVYQSKHRVTVIDREIANVVRQTSVIRKQIPILAAEWALLNQPDRIQQLADQYSTLKLTDPSQFATLEELDCRLPPITSADGPPACGVPASAVVAQAARTPSPAGTASAAATTEPLQSVHQDEEAARPAIEVTQAIQAPASVSAPAPSPPAATVAVATPKRQPEAESDRNQIAQAQMAARLAADLARLKQQHEAEVARNQMLQQQADRLAAQIAQRQKSLEALHAQAAFSRQVLPLPPVSRLVTAAHPVNIVAPELMQLKQQHDAEAATNRRLQAEVDRLATQMEHQQKAVEAPRPRLASARPPPTPAVPTPTLGSFNAVESVVTRLRHEQVQPRETPPPAPSPPTVTAQYRPQVRPSSPWLELMNARAALGAGNAYDSRQRLAAAQSELLSRPSRRHYFAAEQISMALVLMNAGATIPALRFLDMAIANAGGGVPYAAEDVPYAAPARSATRPDQTAD